MIFLTATLISLSSVIFAILLNRNASTHSRKNKGNEDSRDESNTDNLELAQLPIGNHVT